MNGWYRVKVQAPIVGTFQVGWLYTTAIYAYALASGASTCSLNIPYYGSVKLVIVTQNHQSVPPPW
jgi:hypothetical protein